MKSTHPLLILTFCICISYISGFAQNNSYTPVEIQNSIHGQFLEQLTGSDREKYLENIESLPELRLMLDCEQANIGVIFFQNCDNGQEFFFIETEDGEILDPYFDDGIDFSYYSGQLVMFDYEIPTFDSPCSFSTAITITCIEEIVIPVTPVLMNAFLEGAYDMATGKMTNHLLTDNILPLAQPFNTPTYNYAGEEAFASYDEFPENTVDWVLLEAHSGTPEIEGGDGTTIAERQAALIMKNGQVLGLDGTPLQFKNLPYGESYYFILRHRNHLDIMSAWSITSSASLSVFNFTFSDDQALGNLQLKDIGNGTTVMFSGDYNQDGDIQVSDFDAWKLNPASIDTYSLTDGNLDGVTQVTDMDFWFVNRAKLGLPDAKQ